MLSLVSDRSHGRELLGTVTSPAHEGCGGIFNPCITQKEAMNSIGNKKFPDAAATLTRNRIDPHFQGTVDEGRKVHQVNDQGLTKATPHLKEPV